MIPKKLCISKNITLSYIQTNKFKSSTITFSLSQPMTKRGFLNNVILSGVMRRGCEGMPSMALINKKLDELYASTVDVQSNIQSKVFCLSIFAEMLEGRYTPDGTDVSGGVINVIADILFRPIRVNGLFPEGVVESEKSYLKDALLSSKNNTKIYASTRLKELLCRNNDEEFPTVTEMLSSVDSVTAEELTAHYATLLATSSLNVFYIGSEDEHTIANKILSAFKDFSGFTSTTLPVVKPHKAAELLSVTEDMPVNQGKLAMGMRTGATISEGNHPTAIVLNEIFGASSSSKLFLNVREKLGLCYYCSSWYGFPTGNLHIASGIDSKNRDVTMTEILNQMNEIKKGNVTPAEMYAAKRSLEYSYVQIYDSPYSLQSFYSMRELFGVKETVDECKEKILAVTTEDVCRLAEQTVFDTCFFINGTASQSNEEEEEYDS